MPLARPALAVLVALSASVAARLPAQSADSAVPAPQVRLGAVVPLGRYVRLAAGERSIDTEGPIALTREEIGSLRVVFLRDSLSGDDGAQFLKVTTVVTSRSDRLLDDNVQFAITFARSADAAADLRALERIGGQVSPLGFLNAELIQGVPIQVDALEDWARLVIRVEPEPQFVKYYGRIRNRLEYHILVRGRRLETGFTLSVPKVLYDTRRGDPVAYGNTSAMFRCYFLDAETGIRRPISVGVGTMGVDSPIDVSRSGGGFAISLYFDVIQALHTFGLRPSHVANAGIDVSQFFPIGHKPRVLLNARLGFSPL